MTDKDLGQTVCLRAAVHTLNYAEHLKEIRASPTISGDEKPAPAVAFEYFRELNHRIADKLPLFGKDIGKTAEITALAIETFALTKQIPWLTRMENVYKASQSYLDLTRNAGKADVKALKIYWQTMAKVVKDYDQVCWMGIPIEWYAYARNPNPPQTRFEVPQVVNATIKTIRENPPALKSQLTSFLGSLYNRSSLDFNNILGITLKRDDLTGSSQNEETAICFFGWAYDAIRTERPLNLQEMLDALRNYPNMEITTLMRYDPEEHYLVVLGGPRLEQHIIDIFVSPQFEDAEHLQYPRYRQDQSVRSADYLKSYLTAPRDEPGFRFISEDEVADAVSSFVRSEKYLQEHNDYPPQAAEQLYRLIDFLSPYAGQPDVLPCLMAICHLLPENELFEKALQKLDEAFDKAELAVPEFKVMVLSEMRRFIGYHLSSEGTERLLEKYGIRYNNELETYLASLPETPDEKEKLLAYLRLRRYENLMAPSIHWRRLESKENKFANSYAEILAKIRETARRMQLAEIAGGDVELFLTKLIALWPSTTDRMDRALIIEALANPGWALSTLWDSFVRGLGGQYYRFANENFIPAVIDNADTGIFLHLLLSSASLDHDTKILLADELLTRKGFPGQRDIANFEDMLAKLTLGTLLAASGRYVAVVKPEVYPISPAWPLSSTQDSQILAESIIPIDIIRQSIANARDETPEMETWIKNTRENQEGLMADFDIAPLISSFVPGRFPLFKRDMGECGLDVYPRVELHHGNYLSSARTFDVAGEIVFAPDKDSISFCYPFQITKYEADFSSLKGVVGEEDEELVRLAVLQRAHDELISYRRVTQEWDRNLNNLPRIPRLDAEQEHILADLGLTEPEEPQSIFRGEGEIPSWDQIQTLFLEMDDDVCNKEAYGTKKLIVGEGIVITPVSPSPSFWMDWEAGLTYFLGEGISPQEYIKNLMSTQTKTSSKPVKTFAIARHIKLETDSEKREVSDEKGSHRLYTDEQIAFASTHQPKRRDHLRFLDIGRRHRPKSKSSGQERERKSITRRPTATNVVRGGQFGWGTWYIVILELRNDETLRPYAQYTTFIPPVF